jgi:fido (protein-threonine AMPylation protein)
MSPFANDPYCYPGTDVLINRGDLRTQAELNEFEANAVFLAYAALKLRRFVAFSTQSVCSKPIAASSAMSIPGPANSAKASA